jgi:2-methylfumaryl-CoA isomerase
LEQTLGADLDDEADRYRLRETIVAVLHPWFSRQDFATVRTVLDRAHVLWSPYLSLTEAAAAARAKTNSVAAEIDQPGIGPMLATGSPLRWNGTGSPAVPAPRLGEHTDEVLAGALGLADAEIGRLHDRGIIGGPSGG